MVHPITGYVRLMSEEALSNEQRQCRPREDGVWRQRTAVNNAAHMFKKRRRKKNWGGFVGKRRAQLDLFCTHQQNTHARTHARANTLSLL